MKTVSLIVFLTACVACGTQQVAEIAHLDASEHLSGALRRVQRTTPECVALGQQIETLHRTMSASPQWQALANCDAWKHGDACKHELKTCKQLDRDCTEQEAALQAAWDAIEASSEYAEANALAEVEEFGALMEKATAMGCWTKDTDAVLSSPQQSLSIS